MRSSTRTILSLLMLAFLLASMGARGFHSKEFVHDLEHHGQTSIATLDSAHSDVLAAGENPKPELIDEVEHQLFHAVSTLYLLASSSTSFSWDASPQIWVPHAGFPNLPLAELESPFRPPRSLAVL